MTVHRRGERGFTLVMVAIMLVTLLIFAAFAIDVGAVYNHRRQDQSAADSSALAAAQDLTDPAAAVATAKSYAHQTLGTTLTSAQWNSCAGDVGALSVRATGSNCISFDRAVSPRRIRVRLPEQAYHTAFGGIVGVGSIDHSAFAIAGLSPAGFGGVLPFGLTSTGGESGHACLKSGPNGASTAVCSGPSGPGNFGFLSFSVHGPDRQRDCSPTQDSVTMDNIAMGSDHDLSVINGPPHGTTVVGDDGTCPDRPNAVEGDTGNVPTKLGEALYSGAANSRADGLGPRLRRGTFGTHVTVTGNPNVDDNPLWQYIEASRTAASFDVPESCQRNQFVTTSGTIDPAFPNVSASAQARLAAQSGTGQLRLQNQMIMLLERCFAHYQGLSWDDNGSLTPAEPPGTGCSENGSECSDPVFTADTTTEAPNLVDIQLSPRFGYVPELQQDAFCGGSNCANPIADFRAVYIQRMCLGNNSCVAEYDPGFGTDIDGTENRANSVTAWVFPRTMLPNGLATTDAPFAVGRNRFVALLR